MTLPDSLGRPCLRPLEPVLFEHEGQPMVAWRDPIGIAPPVEVAHPVAVLMSLLDGTRDAGEVRAHWQQIAGQDLPADLLTSLLAEMDQHLLLDSPRFRQARREALAAFRDAGVRPPHHCPGAYPDDPDLCAAFCDEVLRQGEALASTTNGAVRGLVAPHIDFGRGQVAYAEAYGALRNSDADLFIVLGVAHGSSCWPEPAPLVSLTHLNYGTPLGTVETAGDLVDHLAVRYAAAGGHPDDLFRDELVHRDEHSIEFQALLLQHLFGHRPFRILPVLCGSLHEFYGQPAALRETAGLGPLLAALRGLLADYPGRACVVAAADLSHIGPRFGGDEPVDEAQVRLTQAGDRADLAALARTADAWFEQVAANGNARNVCSVANLYLTRALLPDARFELLRHDVAFDPEQTVSFAAAVLG